MICIGRLGGDIFRELDEVACKFVELTHSLAKVAYKFPKPALFLARTPNHPNPTWPLSS